MSGVIPGYPAHPGTASPLSEEMERVRAEAFAAGHLSAMSVIATGCEECERESILPRIRLADALCAARLADAYAQGHAEGMAEGLVLGVEGERERATEASWAGRNLGMARSMGVAVCQCCDLYSPEHDGWGICRLHGNVMEPRQSCDKWRAR